MMLYPLNTVDLLRFRIVKKNNLFVCLFVFENPKPELLWRV